MVAHSSEFPCHGSAPAVGLLRSDWITEMPNGTNDATSTT